MASWQAWLLLALTAAAILAIFLLRIRHREVVVSSALLWQRLLEKRRRRSWLELLRRLLSLLLALAIGLSLVLAFARAEVGGGPPRRLALVVDTTASMAARTADGGTRLARARALAAEIVAGGSGRDSFTLYDATGWPVVAATSDRGVLLRALDAMAADAEGLRLPSIEPGVQAWLISDGVSLRRLPEPWHLLDVYEPADNVGITAFEVRAVPTDARRHEAFVEVANLGARERAFELRLRGGGRVLFRRALTLAAGERYRTHLDLSPFAGGPLRAELAGTGDALPADDVASAFVPDQTDRDVWLVGAGSEAFAEVLARIPHVRVTRMSAAEYRAWLQGRGAGVGGMAAAAAADRPPPDGLIFVGEAPPEPPVVPALFVAPPSTPWLAARGPAMTLEPALPERVAEAAVLQDLDLHDLAVERAYAYRVDGARVLVRAGEVPLLFESSAPPRWLVLAFALTDSDLPQSEAFPILVDNLLAWFDPFLPARRVQPGVHVVPADSRVTGPDGRYSPLRPLPGGGAALSVGADKVYLLQRGGRVQPWIVARPAGAEASIVERPAERWRGEPPPRRARARQLWPWLLPALLLLLALEGFTYHRRITV